MKKFNFFALTIIFLSFFSGCDSQNQQQVSNHINKLKKTQKLLPIQKNYLERKKDAKKIVFYLQPKAKLTLQNSDTKNIEIIQSTHPLHYVESNETIFIISENKTQNAAFALSIPSKTPIRIVANSLELYIRDTISNIEIDTGYCTTLSPINVQKNIQINARNTHIKESIRAKETVDINSGLLYMNSPKIEAKNLVLNSGHISISCPSAQCGSAKINTGILKANLIFSKLDQINISSGWNKGSISIPQKTILKGDKDIVQFA